MMVVWIFLICVGIAILIALGYLAHRMWTRLACWLVPEYEKALKELKDESPDAHDMLSSMIADGEHDPELYNRHMAKVNQKK